MIHSPYIRKPASVQSVMLAVLLALLPAIAAYVWQVAEVVVVNLLIATVTALAAEALMLAARKRPVGPALTPTFTGDVPTSVEIGAPGSPVAGESFGGATTASGVWYTGTDFPAQYRDTFFHAELAVGEIRNMRFDAQDQPTEASLFEDGAGYPTMLATSPMSSTVSTIPLHCGKA